MQEKKAERILLFVNSSWNIKNFRQDLIRHLCANGKKVGIICPKANDLQAYFKDVEIDYFEIDDLGYSTSNIFFHGRLLFKLHRIVKGFRADLILSFTIKPNLISAFYSRFSRVLTLPVITGLGTSFTQHGKLGKGVISLYKFCFQDLEKVVFQNGDDASLFKDLGILSDTQVELILGSGVNSDYFDTEKVSEERVSFLFVGRLLRSKGIMEYIQAANLFSSNTAIQFKVIGAYSPEHPDSINSEEFNALKTSSRIEYVGTTEDIKPYIEQCSTMVLPSYREGLPKSILEAMSMRRSIICSRVAGCNTFFDFGEKIGFQVQPADAESLYRAMNAMSELEKVERTQMGEKARELVLDHFDFRIINDLYLHLLNSLSFTL